MEETTKGAGPSAVERDTTTREYIKALLEYVKDDVRQDYLRVTGALAFAAVLVTQIPIDELQRLNRWETFVLFSGIGCLAFAAAIYFRDERSADFRGGNAASRRLSWPWSRHCDSSDRLCAASTIVGCMKLGCS